MSLRLFLSQLKQGLRVTAEDYLRDNLNFGLVHAVYQWAQGTTYALTHALRHPHTHALLAVYFPLSNILISFHFE